MFNVVLENGYFTGMACKIGKFENGVDVENLPNEKDAVKQRAYKLINNTWVFDANKYEELKNIYENEVAISNAKERILELKSLLFNTDYQVLKWKEGELTDEDFEPMRLQRKAWREEIRELEVQYAIDSKRL